MNRLLIIALLACIPACSSEQPGSVNAETARQSTAGAVEQTKPPTRVKRRESAAVIPDDPMLDPLIGEWVQEGSERLVKFVRNPDKTVTVIHPYPFDLWDSVVDNVRIVDGKLHYDVYHYYNGPDSFPLTDTGDHPYSGKINEMSVWPGENDDQLIVGFSGLELPLTRSR
ncbi:MAG: hypothetical protein R3C03_17580 [Pirellulaceae bacterium]